MQPDGFSFQSIVARPRSRGGRVSLASPDPRDKPRIEGGYLSDAADVATLRAGVKLARRLAAETGAFDAFGPNAEIFPGIAVRTDAEIDACVSAARASDRRSAGRRRLRPSGDGASPHS